MNHQVQIFILEFTCNLAQINIAAITIFPCNPKGDYIGWKNFSNFYNLCRGTGDKYINCMEETFYSKHDIFSDANLSFVVRPFYSSINYYKGIVQSLEFEKGMIKYDYTKSVGITLNNNITYEVFIMDQKAQVFSSSNSIVPRSRIKLLYGSPTITEFYLKVKYLI